MNAAEFDVLEQDDQQLSSTEQLRFKDEQSIEPDALFDFALAVISLVVLFILFW